MSAACPWPCYKTSYLFSLIVLPVRSQIVYNAEPKIACEAHRSEIKTAKRKSAKICIPNIISDSKHRAGFELAYEWFRRYEAADRLGLYKRQAWKYVSRSVHAGNKFFQHRMLQVVVNRFAQRQLALSGLCMYTKEIWPNIDNKRRKTVRDRETQTHAHTRTNTHKHTHRHIYMYICMYVCIYLYMYICIYVYIYIYICIAGSGLELSCCSLLHVVRGD